MSIENNIERIADALEALVAQRGAASLSIEEVVATVVPVTEDEPPTSRGKAMPPAQAEEQNTLAPADSAVMDDAVLVDNTGRPWDERIDSSNGKLTAKGVWQARRNVDPALRATVEAELHGATSTTATSTAEVTTNLGTAGTYPDTLAEMQIAAGDIVRELGPNAAQVPAVLAKYGTENLTGLAIEHYAAFYVDLKALLA